MQSSLFLRASARPSARLTSLSASVPRNVRSMGSVATFKVPQINNEPNVRSHLQLRDIDLANPFYSRNTTLLVLPIARPLKRLSPELRSLLR